MHPHHHHHHHHPTLHRTILKGLCYKILSPFYFFLQQLNLSVARRKKKDNGKSPFTHYSIRLTVIQLKIKQRNQKASSTQLLLSLFSQIKCSLFFFLQFIVYFCHCQILLEEKIKHTHPSYLLIHTHTHHFFFVLEEEKKNNPKKNKIKKAN